MWDMTSALPTAQSSGPFHFLVRLIQGNAGVHGNAFPSGHIMLAFVVLVFVFRYFPRLAPWLLICNLLMCAGAVYDGYHYSLDVVAGALLGTLVGAIFVGANSAPGDRNQLPVTHYNDSAHKKPSRLGEGLHIRNCCN